MLLNTVEVLYKRHASGWSSCLLYKVSLKNRLLGSHVQFNSNFIVGTQVFLMKGFNCINCYVSLVRTCGKNCRCTNDVEVATLSQFFEVCVIIDSLIKIFK